MARSFSIGLILLACLPCLGNAQSRTFLPDNHPKLRTALKVYKTIKPYISNDANKVPDLAVVNDQRIPKPASYDAAANCIYLEEKAFDACLSLGADSLAALAALLAHEAMHFYKKHGGESGFACAFFERDGSLDQKEIQESEADLWGLFTAYLAGFEVAAATPRMLDVIYKKYNLTGDMPGYPDRETRKSMFAKSLKKLEDLTALFEAGNYLAALEEYDKSAACYQGVLKDYQSHEMYNNLGAAQANYAASLMENLPIYPFQIDARSKLYRKPPPFGFQPEDIKKYWLREAEKAFLEALKWKRDYVPALINLACIYDMQGRSGEARSAIAKARMLPLKKPEEDYLLVMEAIVEWRNENRELATQILSGMDNFLASQNLRWMQGKGYPQKNQPPSPTPLDRICDENLTGNWKTADAIPLPESITPGIQYDFLYKKTACAISFSVARKGYENTDRVYLQRTRRKDAKTLKDMGLGSSADAIFDQYPGKEWKMTAAAAQSFLVYREMGLVFWLDERGAVKEWGVFKILSR